MNIRGQVAVFVIIAVALVGAIIVAVAFRNEIFGVGVPSELQPVFDYYTACIEQETQGAIEIAGIQGGRLSLGVYEPGNDYAPFSSELQFLGSRVPYWSRVNARGQFVQNVPTRSMMGQEMGAFVQEGIAACDFSAFERDGFEIDLNVESVKLVVEDAQVSVDVDSRLSVSKEDVSASQTSQRVIVESRLGALHTQALSIYNQEQQDVFLEKYAVDVLRSYAPVDGVAIRCGPQIWNTQEVVTNLTEALVANMGQISFDSDKAEGSAGYFSVTGVGDLNARVLYAQEWPHRIEVTPASQAVMIAQPVGNEPGLGIIGFCYAPYHFVYDMNFPVMIQVYDGNEVFQFPVVVVVDDNVARAATPEGSITMANDTDICSFKEGNVRVESYGTSLEPVEARVSYQCFEQVCDIGETSIGTDGIARLDAAIPVCVNGQLIAESEGYVSSSKIFSSNSESAAEFILERSYPVRVSVKVDGRDLSGSAIVHFITSDGAASAIIPEQPEVVLHEGYYNVSVFVYGNSSVTIPASTRQECVEVASGGISGLFGGTQENCYDVNLPATRVDYALRGGGMGATYVLPSDLESGVVTLYVSSLPEPNSLEQLQTNFELFSSMGVEMDFV